MHRIIADANLIEIHVELSEFIRQTSVSVQMQ